MADWVKRKLNTPLVYTVYLEDAIPPLDENIKTISEQFYTILNESLIIIKDIYGPLYNNQIKVTLHYSTKLLYVIFLSLLM